MRSKAQIAGHPLHPMLIGIPVGGFIIALVLDLAHLAFDLPNWWAATIPVIGISVVGALIAAIPGMIDLVAIAPRQNATRVGITHMLLNLVLVGLFAANLFLRVQMGGSAPDGATLPFWLTVIGIAVMSASGFLGWMMVQTYHMGVWEHPEARDPEPHDLPPGEPVF